MKRGHWTSSFLLAESRLNKVLSCKHILPFMKKRRIEQRVEPTAQRVEPKVKENYSQNLRPSQGTLSLCLAGFQNCYGLNCPLWLPFPPNWTDISRAVFLSLSHHCMLGVWSQITCLFSLSSHRYKNKLYLKSLDAEILNVQVRLYLDASLGDLGRGWGINFAQRWKVNHWSQWTEYDRQTLKWLPTFTAYRCLYLL